ncbi:MAG: hypothetical protein JW760_08590 [Spirochaetales bacterium]|nr:hypothetical protein [Spirochaetales bacterium]
MRRSFLFFLVIILLFIGFEPLFAEDGQVIVLNRTGYDIFYLCISPESSDSWGEDLLGEASFLPDGSQATVTVPGLPDTCVFDLKAVDLDDDTYFKWGLNLCESTKIVITINDLLVDQENLVGTGEIQDFILVNDTGFIIWHIYISPDYSDNWEEDLLGSSDILQHGEEFPITFTGYEDHCIFDIKLVDEEGDEYIKYGVDLCSLYEVIFTLDDLVY